MEDAEKIALLRAAMDPEYLGVLSDEMFGDGPHRFLDAKKLRDLESRQIAALKATEPQP